MSKSGLHREVGRGETIFIEVGRNLIEVFFYQIGDKKVKVAIKAPKEYKIKSSRHLTKE